MSVVHPHIKRDALVFMVFAIVIVIGLRGLFAQTEADAETANPKHGVAGLGYCDAADIKPCIVSFSIDAQSNMLVNVIAPRSTYPEFYLTITGTYAENHYTCTRLKNLPVNFLCVGPQMFPGEPLHFALFAVDDQRLLAEGRFNIIGLMLATPIVEPTSSLEATETTTPEIIDLFGATLEPANTAISLPTLPAETTSYPNQSYP